MGLFNRYGNRRVERRHARREMLLVAGFSVFGIVFLVAMFALSRIGPRVGVERPREPEVVWSDARLEEARAAVTAQLEALEATGSGSTGSESEDLALLREALALQRDILRHQAASSGPDRERLERLEERVRREERAALQVTVETEAAAARAAAAAGNREAAEAAYEGAIRAQRELMATEVRPSADQRARLRELERDRADLQAEPLAREAAALVRGAEQLLAEDPAGARERLAAATELHARLARDFPTSRLRDPQAERVVRQRLLELQVQELVRAREEARAEGKRALEAGAGEAAQAHLAAAVAHQQELAARFPESPEARAEIGLALEGERQTALSAELDAKVEAGMEALKVALREGRTQEAGMLAANTYRLLQSLHETHPQSRFLDPDRLEQAGFLSARRADLGLVQDAVYRRLLPVPGFPGRRMSGTEVSQLLFSLLMGGNPSSQPGDDRPVDSVDRFTAEAFCDRLGWILGATVRLPTRDEFVAAVGDPPFDASTFRVAGTGRHTHPVGSLPANAAGFHDLLGNVAEWVADAPSAPRSTGRVLGGSVRDSLSALASLPEETLDPASRSRFVGFRFVVEAGAVSPAKSDADSTLDP